DGEMVRIEPRRRVGPRFWRMIDDRNSERVEPPRNCFADGTHAEDADGAVTQRRLGQRIGFLQPFAGAKITLSLRKFPNRVQQQSERGVGDFLGQYFGRVGYDDAARARRFGIDMVVADAKARNDLQFGKASYEGVA